MSMFFRIPSYSLLVTSTLLNLFVCFFSTYSYWGNSSHVCCFLFQATRIAQKMKFSIKDFFRECDQIRRTLGHIYWRNPWWKTFFVHCRPNYANQKVHLLCFQVILVFYLIRPGNSYICFVLERSVPEDVPMR